MRTLTGLACVSLVALAACGAPTGYYDAQGNYVSYVREGSAFDKKPEYPNQTRYKPGYKHPNDVVYRPVTDPYAGNASMHTSEATFPYTQRGYYDSNSYFITNTNNLNVPAEMWPPAGMCRVWFGGRAYIDQPPVETCNGIQSRVPAGAYIIFGG